MKTTIINSKSYNWVQHESGDRTIYFKGSVWCENIYYKGITACQHIDKVLHNCSRDEVTESADGFLKNIALFSGHFSFVLDSPDFLIACVDKIRSYPIFYGFSSDKLFVSNSAVAVKSAARLRDKNLESVIEFSMSAYVTGPHTLYKNLRQLQAGEYLFFDKRNEKFITEKFFSFFPNAVTDLTEDSLLDNHHQVVLKTFSRTVESLNGAHVLIPLSGGLDSRFVLGMFRELGYDNFSCFTYGTPHLWEVKCAREIARTAEAKWHFIPYDPKQIKKLFCSQDRKRYFHFASGLSSLPSISDYFALKFLCEDSLVSRNSIIINGQSGDFLTGGHIPKILEKYVGPTVDLEFLIKLIIDKHYSLWENLKTPSNLAVVKERIREILLPVVNSVMTPGEASQAYELQEWQERQCKYVVNGQRIYDWLGFDWRLPLWCDELIDFWRNVPWQTKCAQRLYKKYLMRFNPGGLFTLDIKVNQNDCPFCLKIPNRAYNLLAKAFNLDGAFFYRTFVKYYGAYSPFYPQKKYLEYLKDSRHHRNHISYLSKTFLDELCASNIGETEKHR